MAYYKYNCPKCGIIEIQKKMTEPNLEFCPACGSSITRIYELQNVIWKCEGNCGKINKS
jgi:putative FmdB family regulatory protein